MRVAMHEFKSHMSQYVGKARDGEIIELTSHRKVVARITGVPKLESSEVGRLLTSGSACWQGGKPAGAEISLNAGGKSVSAMVMEDRS